MSFRILFLLLVASPLQITLWAAATHGMVASVHPAATDAGIAVLHAGGNAIDAAAAIAFTLGVADGHNSGIGGGCLMLVRTARGELLAIDGREKAPAAATRDLFIRNGKAQPKLSQTGALAIGIPGSLAAYEYAVQKYGRKRLGNLILPAAELAEQGFVLSASYAKLLRSASNDLAAFAASKEIFFKDGRPLQEGERLRQPDLAASYRTIASQGSKWFYRGTFARKLETWMRENGGIASRKDFRNYSIVLREPMVSRYHKWQIIGFPPPSSGGLIVAEILATLEHFDLKRLDSAQRYHVLAETMKLAFADRAHWLGDSDYTAVPRSLIDPTYTAELAGKVRLDGVTKVPSHGLPPNWQTDIFKKHTTHFSVADSEGNWVACTTTVNTTFGSKVVIPGTGILMNNQMDDFSSQPGTTNFFGLVGSEANAVAPGKRPLSSMSPTIVMQDGKPIAALGAAGGPTIISQVVQQLVWMLDFQMNPADALAQPRVHHQWIPNELVVEKSLPDEVKAALASLGHRLREVDALGASQIVATHPENTFDGSADPRTDGKATGF